MTEQEAIKWIKGHHDTQMACKDSEAMRIAIDCIKKQVPKEPKKKYWKWDGRSIFVPHANACMERGI